MQLTSPQRTNLREIHLHTPSHWKATIDYFKTKNTLCFERLLGHKRVKNIERYTHLVNFERDEYHVSCAVSLEEESKLIEAGFEFVRYSEKDDIAIYRKRK